MQTSLMCHQNINFWLNFHISKGKGLYAYCVSFWEICCKQRCQPNFLARGAILPFWPFIWITCLTGQYLTTKNWKKQNKTKQNKHYILKRVWSFVMTISSLLEEELQRKKLQFLSALFKRLSLLFPPGQFRVKNNFAWNSVNRKTLPRKELN